MLCSVCELVYLPAVVYTGRSNLSFPVCVCVCVSVHVVLIQDSAGWSRCKLVTQTHGCCLAGPSNTPLCGPKLEPSSAFYKQTQPRCTRPTRRHTTLSMKHPHTHQLRREAARQQSLLCNDWCSDSLGKLYIGLCNPASHHKHLFYFFNTCCNHIFDIAVLAFNHLPYCNNYLYLNFTKRQ